MLSPSCTILHLSGVSTGRKRVPVASPYASTGGCWALGPRVRPLHYLSVPPKAPKAVITMLRDADLVDNARVVTEKPFGDPSEREHCHSVSPDWKWPWLPISETVEVSNAN